MPDKTRFRDFVIASESRIIFLGLAEPIKYANLKELKGFYPISAQSKLTDC